MPQVAISVSATMLDPLQLQNIIAMPNYPVRVLACEQVAGDDRNPIYAYVTANEDGDYLVNKIKLTRTGLASNQYRKASKIMIVDGAHDTLYHALQIVDGQRTGKFRSLSGPPPLSSAMFSLNEFGIEPSPLIDDVLADWRATQTIAPLRYAVYNQPRNEIEVSFADPSAHNDEQHQQRLRQDIGQALSQMFDQGHVVPDENNPSGRYTRRLLNNGIHNMSLIRLNLDDDTFMSDSAAKAPGYKFAKVSGTVVMVMPSSKRAAITKIKNALKYAKTSRVNAMKAADQRDRVNAQLLQATTPARKKALKEKASFLRLRVTSLNKNAKAGLSEANKTARANGLSGLNLPITADILADAKKLAKADITTFGATGKRGQFKPKFTSDHKFTDIGVPHTNKMPGNAAAIKRTKERVASRKAEESATKSLDAAMTGDSSKEVPRAGKIALDSFSTKKVPGTKVTISAHDHSPASKEVKNIVKNLIERGGVTKGKFVIKGNSIEYKLGTASYRMNKDSKTGKWISRANFGGNGGGTNPGAPYASARKGLESSIKKLQQYDKVDRMAAQKSWR